MTDKPEALLVLPHLYVQNVNILSSPLTWGFPAPSAFTGFVHALHRRALPELGLSLKGVGIVCHGFAAQVSEPVARRPKFLNLSRNPVNGDGGSAALVEEGRGHLQISLVIGVQGDELYEGDSVRSALAARLAEMAGGMRLAGGSVLPDPQGAARLPSLSMWPEGLDDQLKLTRRLRRQLLPGFALIEREDLLAGAEANALDTLLDYSRWNYVPQIDPQDPERANWQALPKSGWVVPLHLGYAAISALYQPGQVANTRDSETPFRFVESVLGLGEWRSPHRVDNLLNLFWYDRATPEAGLYRCTQHLLPAELIA